MKGREHRETGVVTEEMTARHDASAKSGFGLKTWTPPVALRLRAGAAENIPGFVINDGPLETVGS